MKLTYEEHKNYLREKGYTNKLVTLDQTNKDNICKYIEFGYKGKKSGSVYLLKIGFIEDSLISISTDYKFGLYLKDENGKEISNDTKIRIFDDAYNTPSDTLWILARINYLDVKMNNKNLGFNFKEIIKINSNHYFCVHLINKEIPRENIKFKMTFDYWTRK